MISSFCRALPALAALFLLPVPALSDIDRDTFPKHLKAMEWREVGPYRGGRSAAVAGVPSQRETYYFGATGGGVWKTENGGVSWENVSDGFFGGSIGAVAVSEWDPNVVYVGGGEKTVRGNVSPGDGMWKSTDAGDSWRRIGLADSQHISRLRVHPKNPDLVYAAVMGHLFGSNEQRGVYRSRNGGETWDRVLYVSDEVGAVDLVMDPSNPRILYASFWRVLRTPYSLESGGEGSGLFKSVDGGDNWEELTRNEGLPGGPIGISGVAVSAGDNKNLYAIVEAEKGGVFRSRDGGKTWARINDDRKLRQRAWYYSRIYTDPVDPESVYVLNVRFHHSKDGGKSFSEIDTPHGDNHDLWIDPHDAARMIQSNDGGANISYDGGQTWSLQNNQPTAQFYRVSTDNAFPYRLLGGQQDNTAVRIRSRSAIANTIGVRDWEPTAGGESGHIAAKPDNPDIVVGGSYGGFLMLVDHSSGMRRSIDVWPDNPMGWGAADLKYRFQWNFPIVFSKHDPEVLFVAADRLFRSDDLGQTWRMISPDLTRNEKSRMGPSGGPVTKDNTSVEYYGTIFALAESHHEEDAIWVGTDDGRVQVTRNGGNTWTDVTPAGLPEWSQINSIDIHPYEPGGAYLAATRYKSDDFRPYLYRTDNWGRSWSKITNGIPHDHFTRVLRADPDREGLLFAGTERGIYYSLDDGANWNSLQLDLPVAPVTDLAVQEQDLIAATQGRGFWILDDLSVLQQTSAALQQKRAHLYQPRPAYRLIYADDDNVPANEGKNPPQGAVIYYSLASDLTAETELTLDVLSAGSDEPIWTWSREPEQTEEIEDKTEPDPNDPPDTAVLTTDEGLNRHVWDLRFPGMDRFDKLIMWADLRQGPVAVPGNYRARLTVGDESEEVTFQILPDPRSSASPADYAAQFGFIMESRDLLSRTHREITRVRKLRAQLENLQERLHQEGGDSAAPLLLEISALLATIGPIEETLYQTKNESRQDPLNYPIRLNNKLTALMRLVAIGDSQPTAQAIEVRDQLTYAISAQLDALQVVWDERVPQLNKQISDIGIDLIALSNE